MNKKQIREMEEGYIEMRDMIQAEIDFIHRNAVKLGLTTLDKTEYVYCWYYIMMKNNQFEQRGRA